MNKYTTEPRPSCAEADAPQWREEWVRLESINQLGALQVRMRLDKGAIKRYRDQTQNGMLPPPIKLGRTPTGALYLVDGWHRIEAGALQTLTSVKHAGLDVLAQVADLSEVEVRWEAAKANMGHGVPLRGGDYRNVFRAFIKAKKNRKPGGQLMSYREMAPFLGKGHTTIRNWMMKDFRATAEAMGGIEHGNSEAEQPPSHPLSLAEEQCAEALKALAGAQLGLQQMTPEGRWRVRERLQAALAEADRLGVQMPAEEAF